VLNKPSPANRSRAVSRSRRGPGAGGKRAERQDRGRGLSERVYGRFERRLALEGVDEDQVKASFHNGLLTITAAKTAQSRSSAKKAPINQNTTNHRALMAPFARRAGAAGDALLILDECTVTVILSP
jgi:hypothetical protein